MAYGQCARSRCSKPNGHQFETQLRQSGFLLVDGAQPAPVDLLRHAEPAPVGAIAAVDRLGTLHPYRELAAAAD